MPIETLARARFAEAPHAPENIKVRPHSIVWLAGPHVNRQGLYDLRITANSQEGRVEPIRRNKKHRLLMISPGTTIDVTLNRRIIIKFDNSFIKDAEEGSKVAQIKFIDNRHHINNTYNVSPEHPLEELPEACGQVFWVEGHIFTFPLPEAPIRTPQAAPTLVYTAIAHAR